MGTDGQPQHDLNRELFGGHTYPVNSIESLSTRLQASFANLATGEQQLAYSN